jgi:hypothetical protein
VSQAAGNKSPATGAGLFVSLPRPLPTRKTDMTKQEIRDAIDFLRRVFVGPGDVDRLEAVIKALQTELQRRNKK